MRWSLRIYRTLVKLYPAGFRDRYGEPLRRDFADEYAEARTWRDLVRLWRQTLLDFARSMPVQLARELRQDFRHALRLWRQQPLATCFAILVLAIAIGANTGVFSVLNALMLRSLPFREPERLASLYMFSPPGTMTSPAEFHAWRQQSPYLEDAALYVTSEVTLDESDRAHRVRLAETSWNFFSLLGSQPGPGRGFGPNEDIPGRTTVAVIGRAFWNNLFAADPRAIGSTIRLNGAAFTIVGIAPAGFDFPEKSQIWIPTTFDSQRIPKTSVAFWTSIGRLRGGTTWAQAREAFETEAYKKDPTRRNLHVNNRPALIPLQEQLAGPVRSASIVLMMGVGLLLVLACANVASLLLSRTVARSNELMIRAMLGASRARITQQLVTEALLLSVAGSAAGLVVAVWTASVAESAQPAQMAAMSYRVLDWRVLAFAIGIALTAGLVFGVGPALYASRHDFGSPSRTSTGGPRRSRARSTLVVLQIAVTIVLVTGSVALGRAFVSLLRIDNGFDTGSIATMSVSFAGTAYENGDRGRVYYLDAIRRVKQVPGVIAVSATESLPLNVTAFMGGRFTVDGSAASPPLAQVTLVCPGFFNAIGGRVLFGREFVDDDIRIDETAIVGEEFARTFGDPASVIGRTLTGGMGKGKARRIIGVVRSLRFSGPSFPVGMQVFLVSHATRALTFVARVDGGTRERIGVIRDAIQSIDSKVAVFNVKTMDDRLDEALARPKFYVTAVTFFGGLAFLLAIVGVYGVVSCAVAQRTREMGIRLALGTTPGRLRATLLHTTGLVVAVGALVGVAIAIEFGRSVENLVVGADVAPISVPLIATLGTGAVAAVATWMATRRITQLDVLDVLRADSGD